MLVVCLSHLQSSESTAMPTQQNEAFSCSQRKKLPVAIFLQSPKSLIYLFNTAGPRLSHSNTYHPSASMASTRKSIKPPVLQ